MRDFNGTDIEYDSIGNPTEIGSTMLTWQGRQLTFYDNSYGEVIDFEYNADGIRTKKVYENYSSGEIYTHEYIVSGSQIISETVYLNGDEQYTLIYLYDETGSPIGLKHRTPEYLNLFYDFFFFEKNLQGDIIGIYDTSGTKIGTYTYDAWGAITYSVNSSATELEQSIFYQYNPFRYRGYYFDSETGWYYLQTRYYNPTWGRFINADKHVNGNNDLLGYNMFAYCSNNPIGFVDPNGEGKWQNFKEWFFSTFGAGVTEANSYETMSYDTVIYGNETGFSTTEVIAGDISKPVSVYVQKASDWWKLWEYKVGIQININEGGFSLSGGIGESSLTIACYNQSVELMAGVNKYGYTHSYEVDFGDRTAGQYVHEYIRTIPTAAAVAIAYLTYGAGLVPLLERTVTAARGGAY